MTTIVKAADAAQFLSLIPHLLGFHPRDSIVLVPFDGPRSLGAMRFDAPHDDAEIDSIAATFVGMVCRVSHADAVAVCVFSGAPEPHEPLVRAIETRLDACGLALVDALWTDATEWARFGDPERHPHDPHDVAVLAPVAGDQASGAELPVVASPLRADVARAFAAFGDAVSVVGAADPAAPAADVDRRVDPLALAAVCELDDLPTLFEDVVRWRAEAVTPYEIAMLAWVLSRPALRDIALVQWCRGLSAGDEALDAQLRWEEGEEYPTHLATHMWGEGERPDTRRLDRVLAIARHIAAAAPTESTPGALSVAAWISWALGHSTHAAAYARRACDIEPEHGLAEIVASFVAAGHLPDWAFRRG